MNKLFGGIVLVIIILYIAAAGVFTVNQSSSAIILKLGKIEKNASGEAKTFGPGLHFKMPFVENKKMY